ncbi:SRR1-like protein [Toxorhynchites rutilus septentrionalis]|uniref:SRR1-like protein n=1 Tax=Toxorhynchites rutilus septentrionalis TaxID=329112 RepID=UPI0024795B64|nr:SRR1-like protein [Toxorhynchites rutilus septentrionalis]
MSKQHTPTCDSDGFILVSSRNKNYVNRPVKRLTNFESQSTNGATTEDHNIDINIFLRKLSEAESDLVTSAFFKANIDRLLTPLERANIKAIICLGIGKLSECVISRFQLAFVRCLQRELNIKGKIRYYDPILSRQEGQILEQLDGIVLEENLEGKYIAEEKTLFYLPHCPKQISNNLLWRNWKLEFLQNVFLIGNSFEEIVSKNPQRLLRKNIPFILNVKDHCIEIKIENNFKFKEIFNDTSLHYFDKAALRDKDQHFWETDEPQYNEEDIEFITRKFQPEKHGHN